MWKSERKMLKEKKPGLFSGKHPASKYIIAIAEDPGRATRKIAIRGDFRLAGPEVVLPV